jgi:hypothetical protein
VLGTGDGAHGSMKLNLHSNPPLGW